MWGGLKLFGKNNKYVNLNVNEDFGETKGIVNDKIDFDLEEGNHKDRMGTLKIKNSKDNNYNNNKHDEIEDDDTNIDTDIGK